MPKNGFIDNVSVGTPCTEDWNKMVGSDQVRMCEHCAKDVNNLSELTRKDAKRLVRASDGNICIRYMQHPVTKRPVFADQMYQITRRAPSIAAGVVTTSMSLSTIAYGQAAPTGEVNLPINGRSVLELTTLLPGTPHASTVRSEAVVELQIDEPQIFTSFGGVIAVSRDYATPLARAVDSDNIEEVRDLIVNGANVNGKDKNYDDLTPLFLAVENGSIEIAQMLLESGAKVNARDKNKQTALMRLDANARPEMIELLVRHGAKLNLSDNEGNTALILGSGGISTDVLRALIDAGADINVPNREGKTPLMRAAEGGHLENVRLLLESGANANARDDEGENAWDYAEEDAIEQLLVSYGAEARDDENEGNPSNDDPKIVISR